jgi:hypothetical protein
MSEFMDTNLEQLGIRIEGSLLVTDTDANVLLVFGITILRDAGDKGGQVESGEVWVETTQVLLESVKDSV